MDSHTSLTPTPPMGWNSWDCFGTAVTEAETRENAEYMAKNLLKYGWDYIVVDIQWYEPTAIGHNYHPNAVLCVDNYGRLIPAENRFPSSKGGLGFKPLADYVHSLGLKFGIHILRGIPKQVVLSKTPILNTHYTADQAYAPSHLCSWNPDMYGLNMTHPGGQAYYDSVFKLYAEWGLDFIKVDDLTRPYWADEVQGIRKAIDRSGRRMVFSCSPGPTPPSAASHVKQFANMWRISNDIWDNWNQIWIQFDLCAQWASHIGNGVWPDADMLPLGNIRVHDPIHSQRWTKLSKSEQITMMTLWCIARSPLIMGGNLPKNDAFTLNLLIHPELLRIHRNSFDNNPIKTERDIIVWMARESGSDKQFIAMFNRGNFISRKIKLNLAELGLLGKWHLKDLLNNQEMGLIEHNFSQNVHPHSVRLFEISPST